MKNDWKTSNVIVNDINIHYIRTGGKKPPIVLCHGFTDSGICWEEAALELEGGFDVVMFDAVGHGQSSRVKSGRSFDMADDVMGLVKVLGLEKPVVMGHSMGASATASFAARYPAIPLAIVLEDPPWRDDEIKPLPKKDESAEKPHEKTWEERLHELQKMSQGELIEVCHKENPKWSDMVADRWAESKLQLDLALFKNWHHIRGESWRSLAKDIQCKILLLTGDPELGAIVTPEIANEAARTWKQGQIAHVAGVGHCIRYDNFKEYIQIVNQFLLEL